MCLILKAPDRECYAVMTDDVLYIPVITAIYESGTNDPVKFANRHLSTGLAGFWTPCENLSWEIVTLESISPAWREAVEFLTKP